MRKYMNIINRLLFGAVALAALSCTGNFETYNRNPDQPSTIDRDVWNYIKSMQYNVIPTVKNQYQIVENVSGGAYGRYFAYAKSTDAGWNTGMFAFYRIANDWANPPYEVPMTNIYSNWRAIKAELEEPEDDYRMALAQIIRVAAMQRVTDIQGPIPYRTMENNDDLTAPYQSQEAVYGFMLEDLDHAVNVLETYITLAGTDVVAEAASADYVYNGNLAKWIRFANSLKLRLAMRISNVSPDAERYAEEAVAHPYGVIESNADNASLDVSQTNDQNPLRWLVEDYSDVHAAAEIVTYMKSFDDPRLSKYFNPAVRDSEYHGSRVGAYSSSQWKDYYSLPKTNALDRLMWMNAAEVAFLKAEMAVNGWDVTGDAKTLYEEGIRLSFEQYQAENYTSYIAARPRRPPIPIRAGPTTIRRARPTASPSHGTAPFRRKSSARRSSPRNGSPSIRSERRRGPSSAARDTRGSTPRPPAPTPRTSLTCRPKALRESPSPRTNRRATPTTTTRRWPCWAPAATSSEPGCGGTSKQTNPLGRRFLPTGNFSM